METVTGDLFATKGLEYLLVITYLALLVGCWKLVFPKAKEATPRAEHDSEPADPPQPHEPLPQGYFFHQGHTWVRPIAEDRVRVGLDDFAQKAIGQPLCVELPPEGEHVEEGEPAFEVQYAHDKYFAMVSPVTGTIVDVNDDVVHAPGLVNARPYDDGWLLEVRVPNSAYERNLLSGKLADHWMDLSYQVPSDHALEELVASEHLSESSGRSNGGVV